MDFFLPLSFAADAPVKPLVIKSLSFVTIQRCVDLLPKLLRQDLITVQDGGRIVEGRPFLVLNTSFAGILNYSQYSTNPKLFVVAPNVELYALDVTVVDDSTSFEAIATALQSKASFQPQVLRDWLQSPRGKALVVIGRKAAEAVRAALPIRNDEIYMSTFYAMAGIQGNFKPPPGTMVVNVTCADISEASDMWYGILQHFTSPGRSWALVVSIGNKVLPMGLPLRMAGTAAMITDRDFGAPEAPPSLPSVAWPSTFTQQLFAGPSRPF